MGTCEYKKLGFSASFLHRFENYVPIEVYNIYVAHIIEEKWTLFGPLFTKMSCLSFLLYITHQLCRVQLYLECVLQ